MLSTSVHETSFRLGAMSALHSQLVVLDLIYVAVAQRTHERATEAFEVTARRRRRHTARRRRPAGRTGHGGVRSQPAHRPRRTSDERPRSAVGDLALISAAAFAAAAGPPSRTWRRCRRSRVRRSAPGGRGLRAGGVVQAFGCGHSAGAGDGDRRPGRRARAHQQDRPARPRAATAARPREPCWRTRTWNATSSVAHRLYELTRRRPARRVRRRLQLGRQRLDRRVRPLVKEHGHPLIAVTSVEHSRRIDLAAPVGPAARSSWPTSCWTTMRRTATRVLASGDVRVVRDLLDHRRAAGADGGRRGRRRPARRG